MVSLIRSTRRGSVARSIRLIERALDQDDLRTASRLRAIVEIARDEEIIRAEGVAKPV